MRRLIEIPVWHHSNDVVPLSALETLIGMTIKLEEFQEILRRREEELDELRSGLAPKDNLLERYFEDIRDYLEQFSIDRLFQDAYFTEKQLPRYRQMADAGSPNLKFFFDLMENGAEPTPTENSYLIKIHSDVLYHGTLLESEILRDARDRIMVGKVRSQLKEGETGVLFSGIAHQVWEKLLKSAPDIELITPPFAEHYFSEYAELAGIHNIYKRPGIPEEPE